jgi:methylglutaconyl-CoA hydratase
MSTSPMVEEVIRFRVEGPAAFITLNRPDKRNALNGALVKALQEAFDRAAGLDEVRVVVLEADGKVFSAGADLAALERMQHADARENAADSTRLARLFETIYRHPKPVVARVHGHAIAGGCGLAAVCDFSLVAPDARLGFTEVRIGFVPAIVMVFVLRKLGEAAARDLMLSGRLVTAEEAAAMGLVTRVVDADRLDAEVAALVEMLATETSGAAITLTKEMLAAVPGMELSDALDYAAEMNAQARGTADCRAGIAAFLSRTDPPWKQARRGTKAGE